MGMNYPAASRGVSSSVLARHSVRDTESSRALWIPASAGMTNSRQATGYQPLTNESHDIQQNPPQPPFSKGGNGGFQGVSGRLSRNDWWPSLVRLEQVETVRR